MAAQLRIYHTVLKALEEGQDEPEVLDRWEEVEEIDLSWYTDNWHYECMTESELVVEAAIDEINRHRQGWIEPSDYPTVSEHTWLNDMSELQMDGTYHRRSIFFENFTLAQKQEIIANL